MAQEASWINGDHFAVGRWDGTLSIFRFTEAPSAGPLITKAVNAPDQEGIQMITPVGAGMFVTSNDEESAICWAATQPDWSDLRAAARLAFDPTCGVANSGAVVDVSEARYLAMGHANGWLTIWLQQSLHVWVQVATVDLRSSSPVNPWGLHNIRGVAELPAPTNGSGYVVTGSEDGNLSVVRVPDGAIQSATVFNPKAQRGINSLAVKGGVLLVANCAVGRQDSNLWAYRVVEGTWELPLIDEANLAVDPNAQQVFNFDVVWTDGADMRFFCSTEEGALWMGSCSLAGGLEMIGYKLVGGPALGSALCVQDEQLVTVAYDINEFMIGSS
jgi:hypothetical protein